MRKFLVTTICFLFFHFTSLAQNNLLVAEGASPNLYITHVVASKENYYSVGRMYNVSPKELAPYNNLTFEKGLSLGETIKIPLTTNNFSQGDALKNDEAVIPVYHVVQPHEGLYRVSVTYNKVPLDVLKRWNHLPGDAVSSGTKIIVGYLKVLKDQSPLVSQAVTNVPVNTTAKVPEEKKPEKPKKEEPVVTVKEKVPETQTNTAVVKDKPVENINTTPAVKSTINFNGGKFKSLYNDQTKNKSLVTETGTAATFKTTSGWQDGKYYCFHNTATPGTIVKITNTATGKSIFAKVLDAIPDIKQNEGLLLRLSNSAAEELGAGDNKFDCSVMYASPSK